jgi:hypothetical protein
MSHHFFGFGHFGGHGGGEFLVLILAVVLLVALVRREADKQP